MSVIDKIAKSIGITPTEDEQRLAAAEAGLNDTQDQRDAEREAARKGEQENMGTVVNLHPSQQGAAKDNVVAAYKVKVIVIEPKSFDDSQQISDCLRQKKPVVINFEKASDEDAKRILDFVSGTMYALNGEIKKVGNKVFLCAPSNINVTYTESEQNKVNGDLPWQTGKH